MKLTAVPRRLARVEIRALRAPLDVLEHVLERRVVTRLPDGGRRRVEELLGALDRAADRLLHDGAEPAAGPAAGPAGGPAGGPAAGPAAGPREAPRRTSSHRPAARRPVPTPEQQLDEGKQHDRAEALAAVKGAAERADAREGRSGF